MEIWFLAGVILVFFMQCGFTMVEAGFTRAKNAGNIIIEKLNGLLYGDDRLYRDRLRYFMFE